MKLGEEIHSQMYYNKSPQFVDILATFSEINKGETWQGAPLSTTEN